MRTLAKILLALATMMALATSLALGFDESAVDYSNQDMTTLYVALHHTGQGLLVSLSEEQSPVTVGSMDVADKLTEYDNGSFTDGTIAQLLGNHCWAAKAFPDLVTLEHVSLNLDNWFTQIRFELNQPAPTVTAAYLERLDALGYTVTEQPLTSNITVYIASQGNETIRMIVARRGDSTTLVTLAPA
ncbi:MAG TPA: hypothetical protein VKB31_04190 [Trueperaceae bacterium]|nr:hypothetical protein [Trueperaceae bacterium]